MSLISLFKRSLRVLINLLKGNLSPISVLRTLARKIKRKFFSDKFLLYSENKFNYINNYLLTTHKKDVKLLFDKIDLANKKGIVIYPYALTWKPIQRTHKILKAMGEQGYVCFFCDNSTSNNDFFVEEKYKNVYLINKEEVLVEAFKDNFVILYISWPGQYPYATFFPNSYVWFDILEDVKKLSYSNSKSFLKKYTDLIYSVDLVTYSKDIYASTVRNDAFLLKDNNITQVIEHINESPKGWKSFANISTSGIVSIFAQTFLDFAGEKYYAGGAERYLTDLHKILKTLGFKMRIYQKGYFNWFRIYRGIEVCGISSDDQDICSDYEFNRKFYSLNNARSLLNIYSPFSLSLPLTASPAIGISHGVYWDDDRYMGNIDNDLLCSAKALDTFVSVDTNTCNWFQTRSMKVGHAMRYVPNYVDTNEFRPSTTKGDDKIIILYPRRLYAPRGFDITLKVIDNILEKFPKAEFHFVGRGFKKETDRLEKYIKKWGRRVQWYAEDPDDMYKVYQKATISLVPTLFSEGTSLSCLEAMASGNIVIASRVGGLSDLVIDGLNGILIEPTKDSLEKALSSVLSDISKYNDMRKMAVNVAKIFDKKSWSQKWRAILEENLPKRNRNKYVELDVTHIHVKDGETLDTYKKEILSSLSKGNLVYVYCSEKIMNKNNSFGRLQYVNDNKIEIL